jgi:hypothetical protein
MNIQARQNKEDIFAHVRSMLLHFQVVWHRGTLRIADKQPDSHDGNAISVSLHPDAWRLIAHLDGPLYRLEKSTASFADSYACVRSPQFMRYIWQWAMNESYVERGRIHRVDYYDTEAKDWHLLPFLSKEQARAEYKSLKEESFGEMQMNVRYSNFLGYVPTERMRERAIHSILPLAFVRDFALFFFLEDQLPELDGLWWADRYSLCLLSAPHGGIFRHQLSTWQATCTELP